jgi:hypothetical protein
MLDFNPSWRFSSPGSIDGDVREEFFLMIKKTAAQHGNRKFVVEHYKTFFADAAGRTSYDSSSLSWAESDLRDYMGDASQNAPLFLEILHSAGLVLATNSIPPNCFLRICRLQWKSFPRCHRWTRKLKRLFNVR